MDVDLLNSKDKEADIHNGNYIYLIQHLWEHQMVSCISLEE